jgi:hypothetical protein
LFYEGIEGWNFRTASELPSAALREPPAAVSPSPAGQFCLVTLATIGSAPHAPPCRSPLKRAARRLRRRGAQDGPRPRHAILVLPHRFGARATAMNWGGPDGAARRRRHLDRLHRARRVAPAPAAHRRGAGHGASRPVAHHRAHHAVPQWLELTLSGRGTENQDVMMARTRWKLQKRLLINACKDRAAPIRPRLCRPSCRPAQSCSCP